MRRTMTLAVATSVFFSGAIPFVSAGGYRRCGVRHCCVPCPPPITLPPIANDDSYTTPENTTLNIATPGVLVNDSSPSGLPLAVFRYTQPAHGRSTVFTNGSFSYVPSANYSGPDRFTYRVFDGRALSNVATVFLTVIPKSTPPPDGNPFLPEPPINPPGGTPITPPPANPPGGGGTPVTPPGGKPTTGGGGSPVTPAGDSSR
jgi:Bacterial Ig domain